MARSLDTDDDSMARRVAAGDRAARDELVRRHRKLVPRLASYYPGSDYMDAIGDGLLALVEAANGYRPGMGRFSDVARRAIRRAVARGWRQRRRASRASSLDDVAWGLVASTPASSSEAAVRLAMATELTEEERRAVRRAHGLDGGPRRAGRPGRLAVAEAKLRRALAHAKEGNS